MKAQETLIVEGVRRQTLVKEPSAKSPASGAPVIFVFHGHGGTAQHAARSFRLENEWKEAVVVYMQGLPGVAGITDPEGKKTGWQMTPGQLGDRDVKFFDLALRHVRQRFAADSNRVYVLGHSNGARFCNVLWNMRGGDLAAICSAAAQGGELLRSVAPRSVFHIAGEQDPIVPFDRQKISVEFTRKLLKTDSTKAQTRGYARLEPGAGGTEWAAYLHPGGHEFPQEAIPLVIKFFQRQVKQ